MSACERCWKDAHGDPYRPVSDVYRELIAARICTPEEQAGPDATRCESCDLMTRHQHTGECMACGAAKLGDGKQDRDFLQGRLSDELKRSLAGATSEQESGALMSCGEQAEEALRRVDAFKGEQGEVKRR